jgi:hypothetical protein
VEETERVVVGWFLSGGLSGVSCSRGLAAAGCVEETERVVLGIDLVNCGWGGGGRLGAKLLSS